MRKSDKKNLKIFAVIIILSFLLGLLHKYEVISTLTFAIIFIIGMLAFATKEIENKFDDLQEQIWNLQNKIDETNDFVGLDEDSLKIHEERKMDEEMYELQRKALRKK